MYTYFNIFVLALLVASVTPTAFSQMDHAGGDEFLPVPLENLEWFEYQAAGFEPGLKLTFVYGNPSVEGEPYVLRASFPDGYIIPPHIHPMAENLTMLSGTLLMGKGNRFDEEKLVTYKTGDFLYIPAEHPHFGKTVGPTVFQLHGIGPFQTILVDDDYVVGER
jgi:mannose-6-phosphate isomerase-like protein (cupin superfamily)